MLFGREVGGAKVSKAVLMSRDVESLRKAVVGGGKAKYVFYGMTNPQRTVLKHDRWIFHQNHIHTSHNIGF